MAPAPTPAVTGHTAPGFWPVARAFARLVGRGAGGGALVVRRGEEVLVDLAAGHADRARRRPFTADTLAVSFSTTKGAASTVIHRLADRGLIDYDEPVATYWPQFGAGGKDRITVRHLLSHRAGLHDVRAVADRAEDLLDHLGMEERLAARAVAGPTRTSAYHAITYGWLVAGLARRVTGRGMGELARTEVAEPLGIDGLYIGVPEDRRAAMAEPVGAALRHAGGVAQALVPLWSRAARLRTTIDALLVPGFHELFEGPEPAIWTTEMPAVNGAFTADALARMYAPLAGAGDGSFLSPRRVSELGRVQVRTADAVLGIPMRWRLGYHQAFGIGRAYPKGFGHYGYGGSGGWADPTLGLSLGFVTNRIGSVSTPLGDLNLFRLSGVVRDCAVRTARAAGRPVPVGV